MTALPRPSGLAGHHRQRRRPAMSGGCFTTRCREMRCCSACGWKATPTWPRRCCGPGRSWC